ncbi:PH domain-containing protein [Burkholderia gladioli]|uniref:PH domain-containing protein n=1 Tax=Burkholderia gladioli TaxID=28095 RepID=UPI001C5CC41B|nr:PH domain-containing protein [Burkholderia gladioli]MBW5286519.1 PH domain-containing protein [Burkholderia gladioli]
MIRAKSGIGQQIVYDRDSSVPAYGQVPPERSLRFVPSIYVRIPAMVSTWLLLLIIVAAYGLFLNRVTVPEPQSEQAKHAHAHDRNHKPAMPQSAPLSKIPAWCYFAVAGGFVLTRFGWGTLAARSRSITIEPARLTFRRGVLNREVRSLEMTRVKNVSSYQRWWQRPLGIGTVIVESTDWGNRMFLMEGMADPHGLRERILRAGVASRQFYGTTETWVSAL